MQPEELNVGDKVAHITLGDGIITSIEEDGVHVTYERKSNGENESGIYDQNWFRLNPKYLFKRSQP